MAGTLADEILRVTGGPTVNDGLLAYFRANGAEAANTLQDAERIWLGIQVGSLNSTSTIGDMWMRAGALLGISGSLNDVQLAVWKSL